ncbi:MAG: DUF885 family protein [Candidatus Moduliflexus flocculans]|nr:DUF885 family protein [Candidatus Moduliflexus flocculans]
MKKTAIVLAVLAIFACGAGALLAQGPEDAKFKKFQDTFWDAYFKFYPTAGTVQGFTKYNDKLEDPSEGALDKFNEILDGFNQELVSKIDKTKLSADNQLEHEMYLDFLDLEFLKLQYVLPWEDNPLMYNELFVQSLRSLLVKNGASGVASATARAKLIPGLVKRAKDNLKTPPQEYTQAAIDQMPAIIDFYRVEIPKLSGGAAGLQAEVTKAVAALEDYQRYLKGELLAKSSGNFRMPDAHLRTLRMKTQGNLPILEEVVQRSLADFNNIRREMFLVCIPFYKIMFPNVDIEQLGRTKGEEQTRNIVIQGVLDKIKGDHVGRDEFIGRINQAAAGIKGFIQQQGLMNLPEENLAVEPMPPYCAVGTWTRLMTPGAFEAAGPYTLFVKPIPAAWSAEDATSFLEEHNNYYMDFMGIEKIYPGTFAAAAFTRKDPSVIKRMAANQGLLKGWPIFLEEHVHGERLRQLRPAHAPQPAQAPAQDGHRLPDGHQRPRGHVDQGEGRRVHDRPRLHDQGRGRAPLEPDRPQPLRGRPALHRLPGDPGHGEGPAQAQGRGLQRQGLPAEARQPRRHPAPRAENESRPVRFAAGGHVPLVRVPLSFS